MISAVWMAAGVTLVATPLLARLALLRGFVDSREAGLALRKPRTTPVPPVGGLALLIGLAAAHWTSHTDLPWAPLLLAFTVGFVDDLRPGGLGPGMKVAGQVGVGWVLGLQVGQGPAEVALICAVAVAAMNAANTFDCSDGACATLGAVALAGRGVAAPALLGFLPWNLFVRRGPERVPVAYLGDSGSHLVGLLIAARPEAWVLLALPIADFARLSVVRLRAGRRPWHGDRLHLAHRLQNRGMGDWTVAAVLAVILCAGRWPDDGFLSLAVSLGAFSVVVWASRDRN